MYTYMYCDGTGQPTFLIFICSIPEVHECLNIDTFLWLPKLDTRRTTTCYFFTDNNLKRVLEIGENLKQ